MKSLNCNGENHCLVFFYSSYEILCKYMAFLNIILDLAGI